MAGLGSWKYGLAYAKDINPGTGDAWAGVDCIYAIPKPYRPSLWVIAPMVTPNDANGIAQIAVKPIGIISVTNCGYSSEVNQARVGIVCYPIGV